MESPSAISFFGSDVMLLLVLRAILQMQSLFNYSCISSLVYLFFISQSYHVQTTSDKLQCAAYEKSER